MEKLEVNLTGNVDLPAELQDVYTILYKKIESIVAGKKPVDLRNDPTTMRILIQSAMVCVENVTDVNGKVWSGAEKKKYAIIMTKMILQNLANNGKLDKKSTQEIIDNWDFYGGLTMDLAIEGVTKLFNIVSSSTNTQPPTQPTTQPTTKPPTKNNCFACFRV